MKLEEMSKSLIKLVSEYVDLYFSHPGKAHQFYMAHQKVIDTVFEWHKNTRDDWKRKQLGSWMEFMNQ